MAAIISAFFAGLTLFIPLAAHAQLPIEVPLAGSTSQMSQQVAEFQGVVDRWDDAVNQRDQYGLELVLAPQYIDISDSGDVTNRDQQISEMVMQDAPRYTLTQKVVSVRVLGDVSVVNGTYDRAYQGSRLSRIKPKDIQGVFSQVYVRARNTWECINSQRTIIHVPTDKSKKKSKRDSREKPLGHDLGFHFPSLHHTDSQPQQ